MIISPLGHGRVNALASVPEDRPLSLDNAESEPFLLRIAANISCLCQSLFI
ncbi:hypothetical protein FORC066_4490 [Yersinia enterocolitica]|nr:hypothetical protein FORC066_4490 [Yersinia enterocolitica]